MRGLTAHERRLVLHGTAVLASVRAALAVLPFPVFLRLLAQVSHAPQAPLKSGYVPPDQVVRALRVATRLVPGGHAVAEAFALQALLARYGHEGALTVAVARQSPRHLRSRAWVELGGLALWGVAAPPGFTVLWTLRPQSRVPR